ncbi:MAG: hypothetical protein WC712_10605 [Candidatus Brocadiia bacterium]
MRIVQIVILLALTAFALGCTETKFNRGVGTIPKDISRWSDAELANSASFGKDLHRWLDHSYEYKVDLANDIQKWTVQEWQGAKDGGSFLLVNTVKEFELLREAAAYVKKRWDGVGPKIQGLWQDTYRRLAFELEQDRQLGSETARLFKQELDRTATFGPSIERWMSVRREEFQGLRDFFSKLYKAETERGSASIKSVKEYFTKEIR